MDDDDEAEPVNVKHDQLYFINICISSIYLYQYILSQRSAIIILIMNAMLIDAESEFEWRTYNKSLICAISIFNHYHVHIIYELIRRISGGKMRK